MRTIAICNLKGGVGKTTLTFGLATALAEQGRRVLVIDADAQGSLTECFSGRRPGFPTLAEVLRGQATVATATRPTASSASCRCMTSASPRDAARCR